MNTPIHGSFTIERRYPVPPARVYRAWADPAAKTAWFHTYDAVYHDLVPNRRIVYTYDMYLDESRMSVSLATVELIPEGKGTRLLFTEQVVFLDGEDGLASRERGTAGLLGALGDHLAAEAEHEILNARVFPVSPDALFAAYADPERLARWWGPRGFTNTISTFDFQPGGDWKLTMHSPEGVDYKNHWVFEEIVPGQRWVGRHENFPRFTLTAVLDAEGEGTRLTWIQRFVEPETRRNVVGIVADANEQNFDRLAAELGV